MLKAKLFIWLFIVVVLCAFVGRSCCAPRSKKKPSVAVSSPASSPASPSPLVESPVVSQPLDYVVCTNWGRSAGCVWGYDSLGNVYSGVPADWNGGFPVFVSSQKSGYVY